MVPEFEKPQVTEIRVRMDCNGCVQKIKKAIGSINGICSLYFDIPQQKITIVGWADQEQIVRAIKKARKNATVFSHTEKTQQQQPQPAEEQVLPHENEETTLEESQPPPPEASSPSEPTHGLPPPEKPPEEEEEEAVQPEAPTESNAQQQPQSSTASKKAGEVRDYRHGYEPQPYYPPPRIPHIYGGDYSHDYHGHWSKNHSQSSPLPYEPPPPVYVTHCYYSYRPSSYVTEYEYERSTPSYAYYGRQEHLSEDYHGNGSNGSITSMFSDENPNACTIV